MPVPYGAIENRGVKYIKVNRFDSGGLDRSDYLGQLESIRLTYPDRSPVEYPIVTIQEQADYYLYGIVPSNTNNTSSVGEILDYSFTASSGIYISRHTPNSLIDISVVATVTNPNPQNKTARVYLNQLDNPDPTKPTTSSINVTIPGNGSISIFFQVGDAVRYLVENNNIVFGVFETSTTLASPLELDFFQITFTQTTPPFNGSSSLTIFNPEFIDFEYNDYNALLGNADTAQFSTHFMDVDYSQNIVTPINFDLIISGTAGRAFVQDSNYTSAAWSNIRYNGSRTNSFKFI
jgi:hypothetical protein